MNNKEYIAELGQQTGYSQEDTQKLGMNGQQIAMLLRQEMQHLPVCTR